MTERIQDINEAYSVLKEQDKRKIYDRKRAIFIARTFKFKHGFYKGSKAPKHYVFDIEPPLKTEKNTPWYRHILETISSKILTSKT